MSQERAPRISIGLPVRNGERYIRQAIDSLLAQSFEGFELVIGDNVSTDATREICLDYAQRDARVRYHRNERNVGPAENFNRCFRRARGEYFKWAAHDDVCLPTYLQRCVDVLDAQRDVVNCHTRTHIIDDAGEVRGEYGFRIATDSPKPAVRFGQLINVSHRRHVGYEIWGVMRRSVMASIPEQGPYAHADRIFLVRMTLRGRFVEVDEPLFLARRHATQSMAYQERGGMRAWMVRYLGAGPLPPPEWWDASLSGRITFPDWNLLRHYWASVRDAPLGAADRARCRLAISRWVLQYWPKLARDVLFAGERLLTRDGVGGREGSPAPSGSAPGGGNAFADDPDADGDTAAAAAAGHRPT